MPQVRLRILQINPQADKNHKTRALNDYVRELEPDVFAITELSDEWKRALEAEFGDYPYRVIASKYSSGLALFSKLPIIDQEIVYYPGDPVEHPQIRCHLKSSAGAIQCIVAHPTVPKKMVASRNAEMLADLLNRVLGSNIGSDHLPVYVDLLVKSLVTKP